MKKSHIDINITSLNYNQYLTTDIATHLGQFKTLNLKNISVSIDRLDIKSNGLNDDWIEKNLDKNYYFSNKRYSTSQDYTIKGTGINIRIFQNNKTTKVIHQHKIELNPNHFKNYNHVLEIINSLLGENGLREHKITRIDISFTFPTDEISTRAFHLSTFVKYKHTSKAYCSATKDCYMNTIATIAIGKRPHRVTTYDRSLKRKNPENVINFEVQFCNSKVKKLLKVTTINSLTNLAKRNPLKNIYFRDITKPRVKSNITSTTDKLTAFIYGTSTNGLQMARNDYNINFNNHFRRDIMTRFSVVRTCDEISFRKELIRIFKEEMSNYF